MSSILSVSLMLATTARAQDTSLSARSGAARTEAASTEAASTEAASTDPAAEARDAEARALFEAGRIAFRDGRFGDARDHFVRSHELSGRDELLYNIASSQDRLRDDEAALATYEAYLEALPDAENRAEVEARIGALRAALESEEGAPVATVPSGGPTVIATFVTGGLALVTGGLAIGFWVAANDQYASLERGCFVTGGCDDLEIGASNVESSVTLTNVFLVSSLVLAAATAVVLPIELTTTSGSTAVALRLGPGSLSVSGVF
jgi:tetratricopeptide (TPR) repeat protein